MFVFFCLCSGTSASARAAGRQLVYYWQLGENSADPNTALLFYQKALKLAEESGDFLWQANIRSDMAGALNTLREFQQAKLKCEEGLHIYRQRGLNSDSVFFKLQAGMAVNLMGLYEFKEALFHFGETEKLLLKNPELEKNLPLFVASNYSNQGKLWGNVSDFRRARVYLEKAVRVAQTLPSSGFYFLILGNLASVQFYTGSTEEGVASLRKVIAFYERQANARKSDLANFLFSLGTHLQDPAEASECFRKCLKVLSQEPNRAFRQNLEPWTYYELVKSLLRGKQLLQAQKTLPLFRNSLAQHGLNPYYLLSEALVFDATENLPQARETLDQCLRLLTGKVSILPGHTDKDKKRLALTFAVLEKQAEVYQKLAEREPIHAIEHLTRSLESIEGLIQIRQTYLDEMSRMEATLLFSDSYYFMFEKAIEVCYELHQKTGKKTYLSRAFTYAEQSKSLFDRVSLKHPDGFRTSQEDSLRNLIYETSRFINEQKAAITPNDSLLASSEIKLDRLLKELERINPVYLSKNKGLASPATLPKDALYINYIRTSRYLFALWSSSRETGIARVVYSIHEYETHLKNLKKALTRVPAFHAGFGAEASAMYLYKLFSTPAELFENKAYKRLIISPVAEFYDLSFDILRNEKNGHYLIQDKAISHVMNSGEWQENKKADSKARWSVFLPFSIPQPPTGLLQKVLPYGIAEVKRIKGRSYSGQAANRESWFKALKNGEITLLISHGGLDNGDPYISLATASDRPDKVYASEIRYQQLNSPLVILSACLTDTGRPIQGFGMLSMSRILVHAGCKSVAGSFWEADDLSMSVLGSLFYSYLEQGYEKDLALQKAKLSFWETDHGKKYDHPFYWAHFQIYGDLHAVNSAENRITYWLLGGLGVASVLIFALCYKF